MDDLLAILDHEGVEKAVYVGESFGGIMGMQFAHDHPDRCRALVLCNSPCRLSRRESQTPGGSWLATMEQGGIGAWSAATINFRLDMRHADEGLKDWYIAEMDKTNPEFGQALHRYLDSLDFGPHLKDITVPTLLLTGGRIPNHQHGAAAVHGRRNTQQPANRLSRPGPRYQRHLSGVVRGPDAGVFGAAILTALMGPVVWDGFLIPS